MFDHLRPTTLSGIKTLANDLKTSRGLPHARALDEAAKQAGYQNWAHALKRVPTETGITRPPPGHVVTVEAPWRNRETRQKGWESMTVTLSKPIGQLVTQAQVRAGHYLATFRIADGGLVDEHQSYSQDRTQTDVRRIVRTLQFIDATGLVPSRGHSRAYPSDYGDRRPPGADHTHGWYHPPTKSYVMVDEPYAPAVPHHEPEREEWAARHGRRIVRPSWGGMYNPDGGSALFLIAETRYGFDLDAAAAALARIDPLPEKWSGSSTVTPF